MEERVSDKELAMILNSEFPYIQNKDYYLKLIHDLAGDLRDERAERRELELKIKDMVQILELYKAIEKAKAVLIELKEYITSGVVKEPVHSVNEKIMACAIWLLLYVKHKYDCNKPELFQKLQEELSEIQSRGQWPGPVVPEYKILEMWYEKYEWEKIYHDYIFNFLMNKGFGIEVDYRKFIEELYKKWEEEIKEIDGES
mgnify:CR=1 FL=1